MKSKKQGPFLDAIDFITKEATPSQLQLLELAVAYGKQERPTRAELNASKESRKES
tara:strand:- start:397 stop:564 length:168 start_codon:yes stop_codon:yes gene_type:complete